MYSCHKRNHQLLEHIGFDGDGDSVSSCGKVVSKGFYALFCCVFAFRSRNGCRALVIIRDGVLVDWEIIIRQLGKVRKV